jgi:hypothetical protein
MKGKIMEKYRYTFKDDTVKVLTLEEIESANITDYKSRDRGTGIEDKNGNEIFENDSVYRGWMEDLDRLPKEITDRNKYTVKQEDGTFVLDEMGGISCGSGNWGVKFVLSAYKGELTILENSN